MLRLASPRGLHYICIEYSLRRYRMSANIAPNVETQYGPHHALLVMPNETRHRNGITGRTMAQISGQSGTDGHRVHIGANRASATVRRPRSDLATPRRRR
jgi:hypothetical protein